MSSNSQEGIRYSDYLSSVLEVNESDSVSGFFKRAEGN